jgi:4-amino-4-deoxy-L-arabinose transferase-like glycosyltransferase
MALLWFKRIVKMMRFLSEKSLTNKHIRFFIFISVLVNAIGLFSIVNGSNDSNFYAVVAKHIVESGNWVNLTFNNQDWLDKPHLPFWIIALSYKIFGVSTFAYILPGFLFNLLGAFYTFLLAKHIFGSKEVGLLSALFYITALHLMLSSIDVRQEAYLLGEIMPAIFYWYLYNESELINKRYLVLGAVFTACAIMTKGIFILLTVFSGVISLWIFTRNWHNFFSKKWLLALGLSLIFILPELVTLYIQFDMHPEKTVFEHNGVSGIAWFFWGSQFGRFFNMGPITANQSDVFLHYFYFIHTFLWAFLPWSLIVPVASWNMLKSIRTSKDIPENSQNKQIRLNYIYILGSFVPTFILFSLTKFQLDHYTNILIPFAAILCADWVFNKATRLTHHPLFSIQTGISFILCALVLVISTIILNGKFFIIMMSASAITTILYLILINNYPLTKALVFPAIAIWLVFVFAVGVNNVLYSKYDVGYQVTSYLEDNSLQIPIVDYNVNSLSLELLTKYPYKRISTKDELIAQKKPYYLVVSFADWALLSNRVNLDSNMMLLNYFSYIPQQKFIPSLFSTQKKLAATSSILLILIN